MPALTQSRPPIKALILGDSGTGKTGALWSLAAAGFKIRIYDADNGHGVLNAALRGNPDAAARVEVNVFSNVLKSSVQGYPVPMGAPSAFPKLLAALNKWPDNPAEGALTWGPDTVLVIDSLTKLGRHALLNAQHLEGKTGQQPQLQHYGTAMAQLEGTIAMLYSDHVRCHVLCMTHIAYTPNEVGKVFGLPMSLGEKLNAVLPTYFNTMLVVHTKGKQRLLSTKPASNVQAKVESFDTVADEYILVEDGKPRPGLADFFSDCGWPSPLASVDTRSTKGSVL